MEYATKYTKEYTELAQMPEDLLGEIADFIENDHFIDKTRPYLSDFKVMVEELFSEGYRYVFHNDNGMINERCVINLQSHNLSVVRSFPIIDDIKELDFERVDCKWDYKITSVNKALEQTYNKIALSEMIYELRTKWKKADEEKARLLAIEHHNNWEKFFKDTDYETAVRNLMEHYEFPLKKKKLDDDKISNEAVDS